MIKLSVIIPMLFYIPAFAQSGKYIVFDESPRFDTVSISPFKLIYNHVQLDNGENQSRLNIFNLYFSKHDFKAAGFDNKAFVKAYLDFKKLENDVLITVTPLTDSLEKKTVRLNPHDVQESNILEPETLLQNAVRELFRCFTENDIQKSDVPGKIKTTAYKLLIKRKNSYYLVNAPVLTEFYLIDKTSYLFPNDYHYGEIDVASASQTKYFNGIAIDSILHRNMPGSLNREYLIRSIAKRTYLSSCFRQDSCNVYTYWNYPLYTGGLAGIGKFKFVEGIGVINGTYGYYFDKNFLIDLENDPYAASLDYNGAFRMHLQTINGISVKEYVERMHKKTDSGQIKPEE